MSRVNEIIAEIKAGRDLSELADCYYVTLATIKNYAWRARQSPDHVPKTRYPVPQIIEMIRSGQSDSDIRTKIAQNQWGNSYKLLARAYRAMSKTVDPLLL